MTDSESYTREFFEQVAAGSKRSAEVIVPLVLEMLHPESVVDVGCGVGAWLSVIYAHGVSDILGIDGDYIHKEMLQIPDAKFVAFDIKAPIQLGRRFDLAIALEVAEHLPPESAETLVRSLVGLAPVVLFSAAIPYQLGKNHINEQWPIYWERLFETHGYLAVDAIRRKIWLDDRVEFWYRQNALLFVDMRHLGRFPGIHGESRGALSIVHPEMYLKKISTIASLSTQVSESSAQVSELSAQASESSAQVSELSTQVSELSAQVSELSTKADPRYMSMRRFLYLLPRVPINFVMRRLGGSRRRT